MSKNELHLEWEKRFAEFESSGQPATTWCAEHGISISRFRYWSSKLRGSRHQKTSNEEICWLSVEMESPKVTATGLTIHVGQVNIEVHEGFNPALLRQVVQALADAQ